MTGSEKWAVRIEEYRRSGKSQRVWCREQGIKRSTLRYWLERTEEMAEGKAVRFARIVTDGESNDHPSAV